jgi:peroxiredoxin
MAMVEKGGLEFPMLVDRGNAAAKSFGIAFTMPEGSKMDLSKVNGDSSGMLPVPATYVIDTTGKIVYSFVEVDYRKRAEPVEILAAVRSAASAAAMGNEVSK